MLHKAWNSKGKMPYCFPRSYSKFQGHTGQNITDFDPNWAFPDYRPVAAFKSLRFALFLIDISCASSLYSNILFLCYVSIYYSLAIFFTPNSIYSAKNFLFYWSMFFYHSTSWQCNPMDKAYCVTAGRNRAHSGKWDTGPKHRDLYALSRRTYYHEISCNLEAAILDIIMIISLWNLTGISAERLEKSNTNLAASKLHEICW